jgi:hypothetical protein
MLASIVTSVTNAIPKVKTPKPESPSWRAITM